MTTTDWFGEDYEPPKVWTLADIYKDLICTAEIAPTLNVRARRVQTWINKRDINKCPTPVRSWGQFNVYSAEDWRVWYEMFKKKHEKLLTHPYMKKYVGPYGSGEPFFTFKDRTLDNY